MYRDGRCFFFFQAEDGIRDVAVTGVQTCALPIYGRKVLLVRLDGDVYAYEDRCAHLGVPLSQGTLDGDVLTCSAHHYQYDVRTGRGINPKCVSVSAYPVKIDGSDVFVDPSAPSGEGGP